MIYLLARDLEDARQWCHANGVDRCDSVYVGQTWNIPRRVLAETDRIVRTPRAPRHPSSPELERMLESVLASSGLTETIDGRLVRRSA